MKAHPYHASELVQYNHVIHLASQTYVWENVYLYDKDFRIHMSKHPSRSWSIVLQQAWTVRLRDRLRNNLGASRSEEKQELCKQFNKSGRCTFGNARKFEHRCSYCFKLGHGVYNCRKLRADQSDRNGYYHHRSEGGRSWHHQDRRRSWSRSQGREFHRRHSSLQRSANISNNNNNNNKGFKPKTK